MFDQNWISIMIRFQETSTAGQILTLIKPLGKEIPLQVGEILEGQIVDFFPSGGLTIKVKGGFLPARSDLNFQKNETVFLKVLGQNGQNVELALQVVNLTSRSNQTIEGPRACPGGPDPKIKDLVKQLSHLIDQGFSRGHWTKEGPASRRSNPALEMVELRPLLENLIKALPMNIESLPKTLRIQIQQILQTSLSGFGQDIPEKMAQWISGLAVERQAPLLVQNLKEKFMVSMDGLLSGQLKKALENSGVLLEAKIKTLAETGLDDTKINQDLKAWLLQLKDVFEESAAENSPAGLLQRVINGGTKEPGQEFLRHQKGLGEVGALLREVETFQLLSKLSDSFWTFLPVQWNELKKGDLVFKRRRSSSGDASYSCTIHLDLGEMGPVSVFVVSRFNDFFISFKVGHPDLGAMIDSHFGELQENFSRAGLQLRNRTLFRETDDLPDPFDQIGFDDTIFSIRI